MNTHNFKIFVEALEALPASIKGDEVNIGSFLKPDHMCGTVGCFAGLISIVADDIPELKQACKGKFYNSCEWQYALDRYLECDFIIWAKHNPKIWDNKHGVSMFVSPEAFGKEVFYKQGVYSKTRVDLGKPLTHYGIIVHIRKAYDRWIKLTEN
jgi:phosphoglucomutase